MSEFNPKPIKMPDQIIRKGRKVRIVGDHVWSGCWGEVIGTMDTLVGKMYEVEIHDGRTVGAKGWNLKVINE